jgi:3,4-dihydroxy 2-butanone 4-phosphate synthase/GTP cyclohydrolase II
MKAYRVQEQGHDTVEANLALGFAPDERSYDVGARILHDLGISAIRLMTNNPDKVTALETQGIEVVDRVPLVIAPNATNMNYMRIKSEKMGHLYNIKIS